MEYILMDWIFIYVNYSPQEKSNIDLVPFNEGNKSDSVMHFWEFSSKFLCDGYYFDEDQILWVVVKTQTLTSNTWSERKLPLTLTSLMQVN